ncbi:asialoglycoprotein receptor 1-like isoform X2 [Hemicordylus capensis]|uniref:asialoglycoprotein receptor 1-like isoform X2 n=1 Tax=Hemicordylus capensis TaxID=884348 RepID=UPI0023035588|nr:asialoglycoprotein receptor 1-like isoform X2 [Hemicordylus capensis]
MIKDYYADIKSMDVENEGEMDSRREFPPARSQGRRVCSGHRVVLILLGLLCVITIATAAFGISGRRLGTDLGGMQDDLKSLNRTVSVALVALKNKQDLKKLVKIDHMAKNLTEAVEHAKSQYQDQILKLRGSLRTLNCDLEKVKHNKTGSPGICCPRGWTAFSRSCYWAAPAEKSWEEAKADCQEKGSHLAIITSYQEQQFVFQQTKSRHTWIGLSFTGGSWKWVDGNIYTVRRIDWKPGEPDTYSPRMGEVAHCVHLYHGDGLWSDEHCARRYSWLCEMEAS